jgi:hypothetical protein
LKNVGKLTWGIVVATVAVLSLTAVALVRVRRSPVAEPQPSRAPEKRPSDASCLADELASRGRWMNQDPKGPEAARAGGLVKGRIALPWQERRKSSYAYAIYAFTDDGKVEGPKTFTNTDQFELPGLTPGRKAILFYPLLENLTFPYQIVEVPAGGTVEVALRPRVPYLLSGRVVDANGAGVGGVMVIAQETLQLPNELYVRERPAEAASVEKTSEPVVSPVTPAPEDIVSTYVRIDPLAGRFSRGVMTDAKGHFALPVTSPTDPVPLTISRGATSVLKEETVLPSAAGLRIVVPTQ